MSQKIVLTFDNFWRGKNLSALDACFLVFEKPILFSTFEVSLHTYADRQI